MKIADLIVDLINLVMSVADQFLPTQDPILLELRRRWRHFIVSTAGAIATFIFGVFVAPDGAPVSVFLQGFVELRLLVAKALFVGTLVFLAALLVCAARLASFYHAPDID